MVFAEARRSTLKRSTLRPTATYVLGSSGV